MHDQTTSDPALDPIDPTYPNRDKTLGPDIAGVTTSIKTDKGRVCVGSAYLEGHARKTGYLICRLNDEGLLDEQFGEHGKTIGTFMQDSDSLGYHILRNGEGKFMVLGLTSTGGLQRLPALARFNEDGTLDTTFADNGHFIIQQPGRIAPRAFAPRLMAMAPASAPAESPQAWQIADSGDSFIVFGHYQDQNLVVMKFDWQANFVTAFNGTGYKYLERQGEGLVYGHSLFTDSNAISICATMRQADFRDRDAFVIRLTHDGEYDSCFGKGGIADFPGMHTLKNFLVLPADERIIGCGANEDGSGLLVALRQSDGSLDKRFTSIAVKHEGSNVRWDHVLGVSAGAKGTQLMAIGELQISNGNRPAIIGRFDSDGDFKRFATQTFKVRGITWVAGCEIDEQGRLLAHGQAQVPERSNGYVVRVLTHRVA